MTKPLTVRSAFAVAVAVIVVTLACGRDEHSRTEAGAVASSTTPVVAVAPQPGTLAKPIDQMTGDELYAFTHQLRFVGGHERQRRCRGNLGCRGVQPSQFTRIRVDAVNLQDSLSAASLPANGVVAVRAINRGRFADTMYSMSAGKQYEYYLIVLPGAPGAKATWRLEQLTTTRGARAHRAVTTGQFTPCNHPFVRGARSDFKTCAQAAPVRPAAFGRRLQSITESPIWVDCAFGCCTADPPDGHA